MSKVILFGINYAPVKGGLKEVKRNYSYMKFLLSVFILIGIISSSCTKNMSNCRGAAIAGCMCTKEYMPVCGCDGKTYGNACEAKCAGIKSWTSGQCK